MNELLKNKVDAKKEWCIKNAEQEHENRFLNVTRHVANSLK